MKEHTPLDAHGIELVTTLAEAAAAPVIMHIATDKLGPGLPDSVPVGWDSKDQHFISVKSLVDEYREAPARRLGRANVDTLDSFVDLTNRHKDGGSVLFGKTSWPEPKLTAVIDYHDTDHTARWGNHRVIYAFPLTEEFKAWVGGSGKAMTQEVFAAFLEEHMAELASPMDGERSEFERLFKEHFATPSEVLELSRHLEVFVAAKVKQGIRLQSGERVLEFSEEHQNAKGEKVVIPGIFMVSVPAFIDGAPVRIPARLRYRMAGGSVQWFYQLYRWEAFLRDEVAHSLKIAAERTALPAFEGTPET